VSLAGLNIPSLQEVEKSENLVWSLKDLEFSPVGNWGKDIKKR
jgi:hypothetical protein